MHAKVSGGLSHTYGAHMKGNGNAKIHPQSRLVHPILLPIRCPPPRSPGAFADASTSYSTSAFWCADTSISPESCVSYLGNDPNAPPWICPGCPGDVAGCTSGSDICTPSNEQCGGDAVPGRAVVATTGE